MTQRTLGRTGLSVGPIGYAERPLRREAGTASGEGGLSPETADAQARTVQAALDAGISLFHAAHEREAASLGASLQARGVREAIILSTTDGDALDRCPDTEAGGASAVRGALVRKLELLGTGTIDLFLLYDFRGETHTPARLSGAIHALEDARQAGRVRLTGATCYGEYDTLGEVIDSGRWQPDVVLARYNYWDQRAAARLFPACRERGVGVLAAQPFAWIGGVPFVRFSNTWRCRNPTRRFYGFTAAQAHLYWILQQEAVDGVVISMQTPEQIQENVGAALIRKTPTGLESLFESFVEALTRTEEGWRALLQDEFWEYRVAAESYLAKRA